MRMTVLGTAHGHRNNLQPTADKPGGENILYPRKNAIPIEGF